METAHVHPAHMPQSSWLRGFFFLALAACAVLPAASADLLLRMELESQSRSYSNQSVPYGPVQRATWTVPGPGLVRVASWQSIYFDDTGISSIIETFNVPGATNAYAWPGRGIESAKSPTPLVKGQPYLTVSVLRVDRRFENLGVNLGPPFESNSYKPGGYQYAARKILRVEFVPGDAASWPGGILAGLEDLAAAGSGQPAPGSGTDPAAGASQNIARGKPASQSSASSWSRKGDAQGAVDGVKNGSFGFHTDNEENPWWQVDLGSVYPIGEIRVFNRLDYNPERVRTLQVLVSSDGAAWRTVYRHDGSVFGGSDGKPLRVYLRGEPARLVRLRLAEKTWFHLDEVEIYPAEGGSPTPVATTLPPQEGIRKLAITADMLAASSIYNGYTPIKAFDGDFGQNSGWCSSGGQKTGWLSVDLKAMKFVDHVRLQPDRYMATDPSNGYLSAFRVEVWENESWQAVGDMIPTPREEWYTVRLGRNLRKLRFWCESTGNGPQIKEMEIYGNP